MRIINAACLLALTGIPVLAFEQVVSTARYPFPPGARLAVENVQGNIEVEAWDRAEIEVTSIKTALGPGSRVDDVRIAFDFGRRGLTIRTIYLSDSEAPVRVDYRLRVPRQVRLDHLRTVEGDIHVRDVEGSVDARTLNGSIEGLDVTGRVLASAINGNVAVSFRALPERTAPLRLETLNGNVDLVLPASANADLELSTVAGRVEGNYVFVASAIPGDNTRRARVGQGGVLVRLRTVRGNIRLAEREDLL